MKNRFGVKVWLFVGFLIASRSIGAKENVQPKGPEEDGTKSALVKIAGEGTMDSHAFEYLTELSDEVGARVTGSPQDQKAINWGLTKMNAIGLKNVHAEKYSVWKGWTRGTARRGTPFTVEARTFNRCHGLDWVDCGEWK